MGFGPGGGRRTTRSRLQPSSEELLDLKNARSIPITSFDLFQYLGLGRYVLPVADASLLVDSN